MSKRQRLELALTRGTLDRLSWAPLMDTYYLASLTDDLQLELFGTTTKECDMILEPLYLSDAWRLRVTDFTRFIGADVFTRHAPGMTMYVDELTVEQIP